MSWFNWFRPKPKPKPTIVVLPVAVPPVGEIQINCTVVGASDVSLPRLVIDNGNSYTAVMESPTRAVFKIPGTEPPWGWALIYDGSWHRQPDPLPGVGSWEGPLIEYKPKSLPVLALNGQFYYRDGQPFTVIESSAFKLFERFLRGENIDPILDDYAGLGFNTLRVWLLNTSVHSIHPDWFPDFYDRIPEFIGKCAGKGLYLELTVFTQTGELMSSLAAQQNHYDRTVSVIGQSFCFVEGANEYEQWNNAFDTRLNLWKPNGATFDLCRASAGSDGWAVEPVLESTRYHSNDAPEWWRRCAHNGMEIANAFGVPNIANENTRPDHDNNTMHHYDAAAGAALLSAGSCFHSQGGKLALPLTGDDRTCAEAWVAGARSVDLSQRTMPYVHRTDLEGPDVIRAYQRGSAIVLVRK